MSNVLLKPDFSKEILEKCKISVEQDSKNKTYILTLLKNENKRGRKAYTEMSDDELYQDYVNRCTRTRNNPVDRQTWDRFQYMYEFDELMSTEEVEKSNPRNIPESKATKLGYIGDELDYEAIDNLYKLLFKALKKRLIIILNLENVPGLINNALACRYNELDCKSVNLALNAKLEEVKKLLENPEMQEWLKTQPSDMLFDRNDYISTYQKVLRQITDIRDEKLNYVKDFIHNEFDLFEENIIDNEYVEIVNFADFLKYDDEEDEE